MKNQTSRFILYLALCMVIWVTTRTAWASDYHSPRTAALGGAGHAGPILNDSIYLNPAFSSFLPTYSVSGAYSKFSGESDNHGRIYNASIQDGRSELFQAGAGYTLREDGPWFHFNGSKAFINRIGVGAGVKYVPVHDRFTESVYDGSIGVAGLLTDWSQVVILVDNVMEGKASVARNLRRELIVGTKWNVMGLVMAYIDPHYTFSESNTQKLGFEAGLEFAAMSDLFLRFGTFRNAAVPMHGGIRGRGFGFGFGWIGPRISLDYGMNRVLVSNKDLPRATSHTVGFTVYF